MNKNILSVPSLVIVLTAAIEKEVAIVTILPDGAVLPSATSVSSLDSSIQRVFRQTPILFMPDYSRHCWKKIFERINRIKQVFIIRILYLMGIRNRLKLIGSFVAIQRIALELLYLKS